jgi:hypothetical protein
MVAKVDCVHHPKLSMQQRIMAYSALRLSVDGERWRGGDYNGYRRVIKMTIWLQQMDRAPGHFAIMARSPHHEIEAKFTNVSHEVYELTIGDPIGYKLVEKQGRVLPKEVAKKFNPVNAYVYLNSELHEAYHHYLKVITTNIDSLKFGKKDLKAYQILVSSQLSFYRKDMVPEAKFIMDLSPITVSYRTTSHHWYEYEYITSVMALVGGAFTVIRMIETSVGIVVSRKKNPYR